MKKILIISLIIFILPIGYLAMDYGYEFLDVDACLDSGGSYDYEKRLCDKEMNHPYISYGQRKRDLVLSCLAVSFLGLASLVWIKLKQ